MKCPVLPESAQPPQSGRPEDAQLRGEPGGVNDELSSLGLSHAHTPLPKREVSS